MMMNQNTINREEEFLSDSEEIKHKIKRKNKKSKHENDSKYSYYVSEKEIKNNKKKSFKEGNKNYKIKRKIKKRF